MNSPRIPPFPFFSLATVSHSQRRRRSSRSLRRRGHLDFRVEVLGKKREREGKAIANAGITDSENELHLFNKLYQVYREVVSEVAFLLSHCSAQKYFCSSFKSKSHIFLSGSQIPNRNLVGKVPLLIRLGWGSAQSRCFAPAARRRHSAPLPLQV